MAGKQKSHVIIRLKFNEEWTMLFGNSYKTWEMQLKEYLLLLKRKQKLESYSEVTVSDNAWIAWGGLKWCEENDFQNQLDREGRQSNEAANENARQYSNMEFYQDRVVTEKVNKLFDNILSGIY